MNEAGDAQPSGAAMPMARQEEPGASALAPENETASSGQRRLWAPWRMPYVGAGTREAGCIFCNRLAANDDARTLILHRGNLIFAIMNLFPYNTGHVMIVPNAHIASPEDATTEALVEMAALRRPLLRALRRALAAEGFNIGMNVGAVAGAGVAEHFHEHVVPRWQGDANFMPILAATMVIPELIPVTYAKVRAELARELGGSPDATAFILARDGSGILARTDGSLPVATAANDEPIWRAVLREAEKAGARLPELLGWAGNNQSGEERIVLAVQADIAAPEGYRLISGKDLEGTDMTRVVHAGQRLIEH